MSAAVSASPHHLVEVRRGLAGRETQIGGVDLGQLATAAQPTSGSGGSAAGYYQVYLRGQVVQHEAHPVLHVARIDDVVVVEHQHDIVRDGAEIVKQGDKARLARRLGAAGARARLYHPWAPPY